VQPAVGKIVKAASRSRKAAGKITKDGSANRRKRKGGQALEVQTSSSMDANTGSGEAEQVRKISVEELLPTTSEKSGRAGLAEEDVSKVSGADLPVQHELGLEPARSISARKGKSAAGLPKEAWKTKGEGAFKTLAQFGNTTGQNNIVSAGARSGKPHPKSTSAVPKQPSAELRNKLTRVHQGLSDILTLLGEGDK